MRTKIDYTLFGIYKDYKKSVDNPVTYKQYKEFYNELGEEIYRLLINGETIPMPNGFGNLRIFKKKPKVVEQENGELRLYGYRPDWKATKQLWKEKFPTRTLEELKAIKNKPIVFHKNVETDGFRFSLGKERCILKGRNLIEFNFVRDKNRQFNKFIKNGGIKSIEFIEK